MFYVKVKKTNLSFIFQLRYYSFDHIPINFEDYFKILLKERMSAYKVLCIVQRGVLRAYVGQ
jgi:hypothetical protein